MTIWYDRNALEDESWSEKKILNLDKYWKDLYLDITFENVNGFISITPYAYGSFLNKVCVRDNSWVKWTFPIPEGLYQQIIKAVFMEKS